VLHVAWQVDNADHSQSLNVTSIAAGGTIGATSPIVSNSAGVDSPALVTTPGGGLRVFFGGSRSTTQGEALFGMITATSDAGGSAWGEFVNSDDRTDDFGYGRVPARRLRPTERR
jgi:hypothetical protein